MPDANELATLLTDLIAHPTMNPGGDEQALARYLAAKLRDHRADEVEVVEVERSGERGAYVLARYGAPRVVINVHMDTVPANAGWQRDPLTAETTPDRVYGLGAADTKGAIAACLTALERVTPEDVGILFSGDEERTGTCLRAYLASGRGHGVEQAIVCEPTARAAGVRHRGVIAYRADLEGRGGHSSKADRMPKPIVQLARLAVALDELGRSYLDRGPAGMQGLCMNVAGLDGGVAFNVVPDRATLTFSMRPYPGLDLDELHERVRERAAAADPGIRLERVLNNPPFACRDVDRFRDLVDDPPGGFVGLDFWTEAAVLSTAGIDAIVIGPGDIAQAHAADEYVSRADLAWAAELFANLFARTRR